MLISSVEVPEGALAAAQQFASWGLATRGYESGFTISKVAVRGYTSRGDEEADLPPAEWVADALVFWILHNDQIVANVTVVETKLGPCVDSMEFIGSDARLSAAIEIADRIADGPGEREIRLVDIPQFNSLLIWITGDEPRFVDRVRGIVYTEEEITNELFRRRRVAMGIEPDNDDIPGFRG